MFNRIYRLGSLRPVCAVLSCLILLSCSSSGLQTITKRIEHQIPTSKVMLKDINLEDAVSCFQDDEARALSKAIRADRSAEPDKTKYVFEEQVISQNIVRVNALGTTLFGEQHFYTVRFRKVSADRLIAEIYSSNQGSYFKHRSERDIRTLIKVCSMKVR